MGMLPIAELTDVFQGLARSGRAAGRRKGDWSLRLAESGDINADGWLELQGLREIAIVRSPRTDRYLLRPFDVLFTARTGSMQVAPVPSPRQLDRVVGLVEASEEAYASAVEAAVMRRETVRDAVIRQLIAQGPDLRF